MSCLLARRQQFATTRLVKVGTIAALAAHCEYEVFPTLGESSRSLSKDASPNMPTSFGAIPEETEEDMMALQLSNFFFAS